MGPFGGASYPPPDQQHNSAYYGPKVYRQLDVASYTTSDDTYGEKYYRNFSTDTDDSSRRGGGCLAWAKYGIFAANVIFITVGALILVLGAWLRTDSRFRFFLSERYHQAVEEAFWQAPTLYIFSYLMIVLGCCMIVVAMAGCCGSTQKNKLILGIYTAAVFVLMIFTLSCGIYLLYKRDGINVEISDALNYMVQHYYQGASIVQESLDQLQMTFRCCGNAGCDDFRVFRQDYPRSCDIRCDGCHYRIWNALYIGFSVAVVVFLVVILFQVLTISLAIFMIIRPPKEERAVYYTEHHNVGFQPSPRRPPALTQDNLKRHDLPFELRKHRPRSTRNY